MSVDGQINHSKTTTGEPEDVAVDWSGWLVKSLSTACDRTHVAKQWAHGAMSLISVWEIDAPKAKNWDRHCIISNSSRFG